MALGQGDVAGRGEGMRAYLEAWCWVFALAGGASLLWAVLR